MFTLNVNGRDHDLDLEGDTPLLWVLRDHLGLTATKYGCGIAQCGACMVHFDGKPIVSCSLPLSLAATGRVVTLEGVQEHGLHPVQEAWIAEDVPQCGYCQTGQIMAAISVLREKPRPADADIDQLFNICRCGSYPRIRKAIHRAAKAMP